MVATVMQAVTGQSFRQAPATLTGYACYRIKRQVYPGIITDDNSSVNGIIYYAVDDQSLQRLDEFEADVYERRKVRVQLPGGDVADAWSYVISPESVYLLSDEPWDPANFIQQHLKQYLSRF